MNRKLTLSVHQVALSKDLKDIAIWDAPKIFVRKPKMQFLDKNLSPKRHGRINTAETGCCNDGNDNCSNF